METFSRRVAAFPMKVEMLSRFRSVKEQDEIIEKLSAGAIDTRTFPSGPKITTPTASPIAPHAHCHSIVTIIPRVSVAPVGSHQTIIPIIRQIQFDGPARKSYEFRVYQQLADLLPHPVHALSIKALTPEELPS